MYSCFSGIILENPAETWRRVADQPRTMVIAMNSQSNGLRLLKMRYAALPTQPSA